MKTMIVSCANHKKGEPSIGNIIVREMNEAEKTEIFTLHAKEQQPRQKTKIEVLEEEIEKLKLLL